MKNVFFFINWLVFTYPFILLAIELIIFGSVFFLKVTKLKKIKTEPKPVQTYRFRFGFLDKNQFKPAWLGFFVLARFFYLTRFLSGLARFFSGSGSVRFDFFSFRLIKPNRTSQFFLNFNRLFFFWFSQFNRFFGFFIHSYLTIRFQFS
jgi:hypothetical protein